MLFDKLKLLLVLICLVFGGQLVSAQKRKTVKKANPEIRFETVYKLLTQKPKWLFTDDICPFEIFPKTETSITYLDEGCAENPQVCLDKCKNKDGNACYALALLVQIKKGLKQDYSEALFLRACKLGVISGCTNRAAAILNLSGGDEKSLKCAASTFEKTCEKNDPWGCAMFGMVLARGLGVRQDTEKALQALAKACDQNEDDPACAMAKELTQEIKSSQTVY